MGSSPERVGVDLLAENRMTQPLRSRPVTAVHGYYGLFRPFISGSLAFAFTDRI